MIRVADNIQVIDKTVSRALETMDAGPICKRVESCINNGANAIDINSGPLGKQARKKMEFLVQTIQTITDVPVLIDTANPEAIDAGLAVSKNPSIINGFSLEPAKLDAILPLAKKYDADIIGYLLNADSSVPSNSEERLVIASQLLSCLECEGISKDKLIIDPVLVPLTWQDGTSQAMAVLSTIRLLPDVLGFPVRTIAGLSNLTSGVKDYKKRLLVERVYLPMLAEAGLSMVLMNMFHKETVQVANTCDALMSESIFSWELI